MVVMDQQDGAVRVLVGGRDYYESSYNRATEVSISPAQADDDQRTGTAWPALTTGAIA